MTRFQKILKLQLKADKHMFRQPYTSTKPEAIDHFIREGIDKRISKNMRKRTGSIAKVC